MRSFDEMAEDLDEVMAELEEIEEGFRELHAHDLTMREVDVLQLIAFGVADIEIGERLCLSKATVKSHVRHILERMRVHSRTHAVAVAYRAGVIG